MVDGYFDISNNGLISLEGCPKIVTRDFNCSKNNLTSLFEGPTEVAFINKLIDDGKIIERGQQRIDHLGDKLRLILPQLWLGKTMQGLPIRFAAEELPIPPDGARLHRLALGR